MVLSVHVNIHFWFMCKCEASRFLGCTVGSHGSVWKSSATGQGGEGMLHSSRSHLFVAIMCRSFAYVCSVYLSQQRHELSAAVHLMPKYAKFDCLTNSRPCTWTDGLSMLQ